MKRTRAALITTSAFLATRAFSQDPIFIAADEQNRLIYRVEYPLPVRLEPSQFEKFNGWISFGVGFEPLSDDEPENGMFALSELSDIEFVLLTADPDMHVYTRDRTRFLEVGETYHLGNPYFHHHPVWELTHGKLGEEHSLTLQFRDRTGMYESASPLTMTFITVPAVSSTSAMMGGLAVAMRRRRGVR